MGLCCSASSTVSPEHGDTGEQWNRTGNNKPLVAFMPYNQNTTNSHGHGHGNHNTGGMLNFTNPLTAASPSSPTSSRQWHPQVHSHHESSYTATAPAGGLSPTGSPAPGATDGTTAGLLPGATESGRDGVNNNASGFEESVPPPELTPRSLKRWWRERYAKHFQDFKFGEEPPPSPQERRRKFVGPQLPEEDSPPTPPSENAKQWWRDRYAYVFQGFRFGDSYHSSDEYSDPTSYTGSDTSDFSSSMDSVEPYSNDYYKMLLDFQFGEEPGDDHDSGIGSDAWYRNQVLEEECDSDFERKMVRKVQKMTKKYNQYHTFAPKRRSVSLPSVSFCSRKETVRTLSAFLSGQGTVMGPPSPSSSTSPLFVTTWFPFAAVAAVAAVTASAAASGEALCSRGEATAAQTVQAGEL
eukprot:TRINITY_DN14017_c0_g1_i1.p1 TRINITY_DN14017_c0_g1~~TRINITY_DN14017_c0_g1_i1.p1  ORF type:complete len:410 (-),score=53.67 TRINITY_DN14017_c0_g1_i1:147-1376(-)